MFQAAQQIYVWIKSNDGEKVESHMVQSWEESLFGVPPDALIFDELVGLRCLKGAEIVRFSLDERDQQPLMVRSNSPAPPNAPTSAIADIPTEGREIMSEQRIRHFANAQPHIPHPMRQGLVEV